MARTRQTDENFKLVVGVTRSVARARVMARDAPTCLLVLQLLGIVLKTLFHHSKAISGKQIAATRVRLLCESESHHGGTT